MPTWIPILLAGLHAALSSAPTITADIQQLIASMHTLFNGLFSSGLITADQQNQLHAWVDARAAEAAAGQAPPSWLVMPDPTPAEVAAATPGGVPPPASSPPTEQTTVTASSGGILKNPPASGTGAG